VNTEPYRVRVVDVDEHGIISVRHPLNTEDIEVVALETEDGRRIGAVSANVISPSEIEVVQVPGGPPIHTVVLARREAETPS
jgi:citrate lyase beta subunit